MSKLTQGTVLQIDRSQINDPIIELTDSAKVQLDLIYMNDLTVLNKVIRISIDGKKCEGFTYSIGFDTEHEDDFKIKIDELNFVLDPFCAHYLQKSRVDFIQDFSDESEDEGFIVTNINQENFQGKFWIKDPEKRPVTITE